MTRRITQSFFVPGVLPGLNEIIKAAHIRKGRWSKYTQMKKDLLGDIGTEITRAKLKPMVSCDATFFWAAPNKRRDVDNIAVGKKFLLDALVEASILPNDGWSVLKSITDTFDVNPHSPGVLVELKGRR